MLAEYLPILIFLAVAGGLGVLLLSLGFLFGPRRPDTEKLSAYECGFEAFEDSRMKFDVRYYLTGRNLRHYPPTVKRIEAIDPDLDLDRLSMPRIAKAAIKVDFHHLDAAHLPFKAARFDTVVSTFTLCSIPDVVHALGEVRRVLKPGGQFLFLEHGRAPDPAVARWQDRLNPAWMPLAGGCHLNRPIRALVEDAGLVLGPVQNYYLKQAPRFAGYMTEGIAKR